MSGLEVVRALNFGRNNWFMQCWEMTVEKTLFQVLSEYAKDPMVMTDIAYQRGQTHW